MVVRLTVTLSTPAPSCRVPLNTPLAVVVLVPMTQWSRWRLPPPLLVTVPAPASAPIVTVLTPPVAGPAAVHVEVVFWRRVNVLAAAGLPRLAELPDSCSVPSSMVTLPVNVFAPLTISVPLAGLGQRTSAVADRGADRSSALAGLLPATVMIVSVLPAPSAACR